MKKILKEKVLEEATYYCDVHPDRECYSELKTMSWYGSQFDMMSAEIHLCDECLKELYEYLKQKYKIEPVEIEI